MGSLFLLSLSEVLKCTPKGLRLIAIKIAVTRWMRQIILVVAVLVLYIIAFGPMVSLFYSCSYNLNIMIPFYYDIFTTVCMTFSPLFVQHFHHCMTFSPMCMTFSPLFVQHFHQCLYDIFTTVCTFQVLLDRTSIRGCLSDLYGVSETSVNITLIQLANISIGTDTSVCNMETPTLHFPEVGKHMLDRRKQAFSLSILESPCPSVCRYVSYLSTTHPKQMNQQFNTVVVFNLGMCMKEDNHGLNNMKGDNHGLNNMKGDNHGLNNMKGDNSREIIICTG